MVDVIRVVGRFGEEELTEDSYYYRLGKDALDQGRAKEALRHFKISLYLREHFKTLSQMSVCYDRLGLGDLALKYAGLAHRAAPRNNKTAYLFAEQLIRNDRLAEAREILQSISTVDPSYKKARLLLEDIDGTDRRGAGRGSHGGRRRHRA